MPGGAKQKKKEQQKQNKNKVKVDPTFGLKNKKGKKNREFVHNAVNNMNADEIRKKKEREVIYVDIICIIYCVDRLYKKKQAKKSAKSSGTAIHQRTTNFIQNC